MRRGLGGLLGALLLALCPAYAAAFVPPGSPNLGAQLLGYGALSLTVGATTEGTYALDYVSVAAATVGNPPVWVANIPITLTSSGLGQLPLSIFGWVSLTAQAVDVDGNTGTPGPVYGVQEPQGPSIAASGLSSSTPTAEVLSWADEGPAAVSYIVAAGTSASGDPLPLTLTQTSQTSYTYVFSPATAVENLVYRVYAVDADGVTSPAAADSVDKAYSYGVPQFASFNDPFPVTYTPASFSPTSFTAVWTGVSSNPVGPLPAPLTYSLYGSTLSAQASYTQADFTWLTSTAGTAGSLTITGQPQVLSYYLSVSDGAVSSPLAPPASSVLFAPVLATPVLQAGQGIASTVLLNWAAVPYAAGYNIYRTDLSWTAAVLVGNASPTTSTSVSFTDAASFSSGPFVSSNPLIYAVQAYLSPISPTVSGSDTSAISAPVEVPNPNAAPAPQNFTALATGLGGTVKLAWLPVISPATNGLSSYDVYYSNQTSNPLAPTGVTTVNVVSSTTAVTLTGLQDGALTWFWVAGSIGSNGSDAGAFSLPAAAVPYSVPQAPTLSAGVLSFGQGLYLDVSHTAAPDVALGAIQIFEIPNSVTSLVATLDPSAPYVTLSAGAFPCGTPLSFTAQDVDIAGNTGTPSKAYWVEAPCSPTVQATLLSPSALTLTLSWTAPKGGAASYAIFSATGPGWIGDPLPNTVTTGTGALSFPVPVTPGASEWYRVYSVSSLGVSSAASSEWGMLAPPTQLQAIPGSGQVYLSWTPPAASADEGLDSYVVYYSSAAGFVAATPTSTFGLSPGALALTVSSAAQGLTLTGLQNLVPYAFAVASRDGSGSSVSGSASAFVTMTTGLLGPLLSSVATSPPLGSSLSFSNPLSPTAPGPTAFLLAQWGLGDYTPLTSTVYSIYDTTDATSTPQTFSVPQFLTATTFPLGATPPLGVTLTVGAPGPVWYFVNVTDSGMPTNDSGWDTSNARTAANAYFAPNLAATSLTLLAPSANGRILLSWTPVPFADSYTVYRATQDISTAGSSGLTYSALANSVSPTVFTSLGEVLESLSYTSEPLTFVDTAPVENSRNAYEVVPLRHASDGSVLAGPGSNAVTRTPRVLPQDPGFWDGAGGSDVSAQTGGDYAGASGFYVTASAQAESGGVFLEWTPSGAGSYPISAYSVYRGFSPSGLTILATTTWDVTGTATGLTINPMPFVVDGAPPQPVQDVYYGVQAMDVSGNVSPDVVTTTVSAPQLWPAPSLLLDQYYSGSKQVALTWAPSTLTAGTIGTFPFASWQVERVAALGASPTVLGPSSLSLSAGGSLSAMTRTTAMDLAPVPGNSLYLISAVDAQGNVGPALGLSVTVGGPSATTLVAGVVTGLSSTPGMLTLGSGYVLGQTLSWAPNPASDVVSAYEVFRADGLASTSDWALNPPYGDTSGTADAVGTLVTYAVAAKNSHGLGVSSTPLTVYWSPPSPAWLSFTADIPSGVSQSPAVGLVWQDVLHVQGGALLGYYAGSYCVFRSDKPNTPLAGCSGLSVSAACTDVSPLASASYSVESVLTNDNSAPVNVGLAVPSAKTAALGPLVLPTLPPSAPAAIGAASGPAGVSLTWTASAGPCYCAVEYWIYRSSAPLNASPPYADFLSRVTGTAFVDLGLSGTAGLSSTTQTEPYYAVAAANAFEVGPALPVTTFLSPPSALSAMAGSVGAAPGSVSPTVTLSWAPSLSGALVTGYNVYRSTGGAQAFLGGVTGTGYTDALTLSGGLTNTTLSYTVMAAGLSLVSACATPLTITAYDLPLSPVGLLGGGTSTGVVLTWKPAGAAQGVTGYAVAWNVLDASGGGVTQVAASPAEWSLGGLLPAQAVTVTVQALNSAGASSPSAQVALTVSAEGPAAAPLSFTVQSGLTPLSPGQSAVLLSFSAPPGADTLVIYRSPAVGAVLPSSVTVTAPLRLSDAAGGGASPYYLTTVSSSLSSLTDSAVSAHYGYSYAITAVNAAGLPTGESVPLAASPTCVTAFASWAPPAISATAGNARVDLWWTPPPLAGAGSNPLSGYRLYRKTGAGPVAITAASPPDPGFPLNFGLSQTAYTDTSVANGSTYSYGMTCVDTQGNESAVAAAPQYPLVDGTVSGLAPTGPLAPPSNLSAIPGNNSVTLQWVTLQSDAGNGGLYNVYRRLTTTARPQYGPASYGPPLANLFHVGPTIVSYPTGISLQVESLVDAPFLATSPPDKVMECYAIAAVNASGEGPKSRDLCVTPFNPLDPAQFPGSARVSATIEATTEVLLTWTQIPANGNTYSGGYTVTAYHVYRSQDDGNTYTLLNPVSPVAETAGPTATNVPATYVDTNQAKGVSFYYRVVPVDSGGNEGLAYDLVFVDIPAGTNNLYVFRNSFDPKLGGSVPIQCGLSRVGMYWVKIYTLNGEYVDTVIPPTLSNSTNYLSPQVSWNGTNAKGQTVASGVYVIHLEGPGFHTDARVAVIK